MFLKNIIGKRNINEAGRKHRVQDFDKQGKRLVCKAT